MKVSKIIEGALKQLGVLAAGENAQADELADAVDCLHGLLAQWATNRLYVYKANVLVLKLDGSGTFRIVPKRHSEDFCCDYVVSECDACASGEMNSDECSCGSHQPPQKIDLDADIQSIHETAFLDDNRIDLLRDTNQTSLAYMPVTYSIDGCEWVFNIKDTSAKELKIKVFTFPESIDCDDELVVPTNFERALRLTLALEIAPMFSVEPSMTLLKNQDNALRLLSKSNVTPIYANNSAKEIGIGLGRGYGC